MPIDLRNVEPLASKSVLAEQAMRRQHDQRSVKRTDTHLDMHADMDTPLPLNLQWIEQDGAKIQNMIKELDTSIAMMAKQTLEVHTQNDRTRKKMEDEQQLMFRQIQTLNNLLKKQVSIFSAMETQINKMDIKQSNGLSMIAVGVISGIAAATTMVVAAPLALTAMRSFGLL